jgi:hypothetical protein
MNKTIITLIVNTPFPGPAEAGQAFPHGEGALCKAFPPWGKQERGLFENKNTTAYYHFNILFLAVE